MKSLLLALCVVTSLPAASLAPETVAGMAFHSLQVLGSTRAKAEANLLLGSGGRFEYLRYAAGSTVQNPEIELRTPPASGGYTYQRTGDATATLTLSEPGGTLPILPATFASELRYELTFTTADSGTWSLGAAEGSFQLSPLGAAGARPVINVSLRTNVAPGQPAIVGWVVPDNATGHLLVRVVGPSLTQFGVSGTWSDPRFALQLGPANSSSRYNDWSADPQATAAIQRLSSYVGAFPLTPGSKDAAAVLRLIPGAYTLVCSTEGSDPGGEVLIEVYTLP